MDIRLGRIPPDSTRYQEGEQKRKRAKKAETEPPADDAAETVEDCYVPSNESEEESAE